AERSERERLSIRRRQRGGPAQRARLRGGDQRHRGCSGDGPLRQHRARPARVGEKSHRRPASRLEKERMAPHAQAVRDTLDFVWQPLFHCCDVTRDRKAVPASPTTTPTTMSAPPASSWPVRRSPMSTAAQMAAKTGSRLEMSATRTGEISFCAQVWMPKASNVAKSAR